MGRLPEPKTSKLARDTCQPDRDKSRTVALPGDTPETPEGLGTVGKQ